MTRTMVDKVRAFDNELSDFVAGQTPCWLVVSGFFRDEACVAWLRATSQKLEDVLTELHDKHCILPGAVLYMIAEEWHYIHQYKNRSQDEIDRLAPLEKTLSDNRCREIKKSLKILKAAILEIKKWKPMIWSLYNVDWSKLAVTARFYSDINSQMMIEELNHLEHNVRQLNRTKPGRPQLTQLRKCARNLAAFFRQFIEGRPCHEYTATILAKSFPAVAQWCSHDNIRKLIDRGPADLPGPNLIRDYAFALQRRDPEYTDHFRKLDEQFQTVIKEREMQQKLIQKRQRLIEKELKALRRNGHQKRETPHRSSRFEIQAPRFFLFATGFPPREHYGNNFSGKYTLFMKEMKNLIGFEASLRQIKTGS